MQLLGQGDRLLEVGHRLLIAGGLGLGELGPQILELLLEAALFHGAQVVVVLVQLVLQVVQGVTG
ncbi:hypothetical protein D3C86_1931850 [compost metagenome]